MRAVKLLYPPSFMPFVYYIEQFAMNLQFALVFFIQSVSGIVFPLVFWLYASPWLSQNKG